MAQSADEKKGYTRGYQSSADRWPLHRPPLPPDPIIRNLMDALQKLRDEYDTMCATFDANDEIVLKLNEPIARADAALSAVSTWLRHGTIPSEPPC